MDSNERRGHVPALYSSLPGSWPLLEKELAHLRAQFVADLIVSNDEQKRGRIKMIDELLRLPETLRQEMDQMAQSLPE